MRPFDLDRMETPPFVDSATVRDPIDQSFGGFLDP